MLESLLLQNFQNHDRRLFEFGPGVNALVGASERGKSAVLRALLWVMTNQGDGLQFVGQWGEAPFALAKLKVDGHAVYRRRSSKENLYRLDAGQPLKAFGRGVPQDVEALVNVGPANFQQQLDGPYWFMASGGEVARNLNVVVDLQEIDEALDLAAKEVRRTRASLEVTESRLAQAKARVEELAWVPEAARLLKVAEKEAERGDVARTMFDCLRRLRDAGRQAAARAAQADKDATAAQHVATAMAQFIELRERRSRLASLAAKEKQLAAVIQTPLPNGSAVQEAVQEYEEVKKRRQALASLWLWMKQLEDEVCRHEKDLSQLETKLQEPVDGTCPTCGQSWQLSPTSTSTPTRPPAEVKRTGLKFRPSA